MAGTPLRNAGWVIAHDELKAILIGMRVPYSKLSKLGRDNPNVPGDPAHEALLTYLKNQGAGPAQHKTLSLKRNASIGKLTQIIVPAWSKSAVSDFSLATWCFSEDASIDVSTKIRINNCLGKTIRCYDNTGGFSPNHTVHPVFPNLVFE